MSQTPTDFRPVMSVPSRWIVRVLAWTALGLSAYLTITSLSHTKVVGCAAGETVDCDSVLSGQWSVWLGLPVALGGLACYAALASLSVLLGLQGAAARRWIGTLVVMLSVVAGGAGLWFIGLQLLVIHKICMFCMGVHACGVTIAAVVLWTMVLRPAISRRSLSRQTVDRQVIAIQSARSAAGSASASGLDVSPPIGLALGGAVAVLMLLVGGQTLFPPDTYTTVNAAAIGQAIEMDAADEPATTVPLAADQPDADGMTARGGESAVQPVAERPATAAQPTRGTGAADDLFAELDQPAGRDDAADLFTEESNQPAVDEPAEDLFATATDRAPAAPAATGGDQTSADQFVARSDQLEPVVPVSTASGPQAATTADWRNVADSSSEAIPARQERKVSLLNGKLKLDIYKHPVLGPMDAPNVIVELMSYDCPHCRKMHKMIQQGLKRYDGQLAIVEMVVPLEMGCNKYITTSKYSHRGSCTLTRLALAVAQVDPTAFAEFHEWLLADATNPPSPEKATARAYQLVDRDRLNAVMQSDELKGQIDGYVELYTILENLSKKQGKAFGLPVQIVGRTIVSGDLADAGQLYWTWEKNLGLRPHAPAPVGQTSSNP
jgi:uncharacterized membrane protein/protein-disulfide isomerase